LGIINGGFFIISLFCSNLISKPLPNFVPNFGPGVFAAGLDGNELKSRHLKPYGTISFSS